MKSQEAQNWGVCVCMLRKMEIIGRKYYNTKDLGYKELWMRIFQYALSFLAAKAES